MKTALKCFLTTAAIASVASLLNAGFSGATGPQPPTAPLNQARPEG
jgi:hypothetical protein